VRAHATDNPDELAVNSYLLLYRNRGAQSTADLFSAERQDLLRRIEGGWRLARRTILLDQAVVGARHISVFF
jgi:3-phenylpropionate/cinnamic acid dioxygenase small subunit